MELFWVSLWSFVGHFNSDGTSCARSVEPVIQTHSGSIAGTCNRIIDTNVASFLGIPFAKPPIEDKRFSKAEPIDKWNETLLAKKKPPSCMQFSSRNFSWIPSSVDFSEDCLYLNIWTPNKCCRQTQKLEKLPVMVWIHGGGYYAGSSSMDAYDGSVLASYGKVVVVSINYRLGLFGFFNGGTSEAPGNIGLYDQILALKWIKTNIERFGGDPDKITVFGESSGSMSISLHLISSMTKGLFHRAIMQSGTSFNSHLVDDINTSLFKSDTLAKIAGCSSKRASLVNKPSKVIKCMKSKNASELAQIENTFTSKFPIYFTPYFGSSCTGCNEILPESPFKMIKSNKVLPIPILIGDNKDEGAIFLSYMMPSIFLSNQTVQLSLVQAKKIIKQLFSTAPEIPSELVFEYYFSGIANDNSSAIVNAISNAYGDYAFVCPTIIFAEAAKPYTYWMTYRSKKDSNNEWLGVTHFAEIPYIFGKPFLTDDSNKYTTEDKNFSSYLMKKWTEFARDGVLLENETSRWQKYSKNSPLAYELNLSSKESPIRFPRLEACEFWRPYFVSRVTK